MLASLVDQRTATKLDFVVCFLIASGPCGVISGSRKYHRDSQVGNDLKQLCSSDFEKPEEFRVPGKCVIGLQWGDEAKGKLVDLLTEGKDLVVRYQGGANAGHTVVIGDDVYKLHHIPSAVSYTHLTLPTICSV